MNTCIVCEYGWIIVGKKEADRGNRIELSKASVVRSWSNGKGIGAISQAKFKDEYVIDPIGDVIIYADKVLFEIPCEW